MSYSDDKPDQLQKYSGLPSKQDEKEKSAWAKFLDAMLPWVTKKWDLGNAYLEAKVEKEKNEADKIKAETDLLKIQAEKDMREVIDIAAKEDESTAQVIEIKENYSEEELDSDLKELQEKIRLLYLKYGMKISVSIGEKESMDLLGEEELWETTLKKAGNLKDFTSNLHLSNIDPPITKEEKDYLRDIDLKEPQE